MNLCLVSELSLLLDLFTLDFQDAGSDEPGYANSQEIASDLNMTSTSTEIPGGAELMKQIEQNYLDNVSVPGCLPEHNDHLGHPE